MKNIDDGLKQRLIGAVVLLAAAIVFLPVLFDRDYIEPIDKTTQIPPEPEVEPVVIAPPSPPKGVTPAPSPQNMFVPDEAGAVPLNIEEPGFKSTGEPKTWTLQVAAYRFDAHADKMRNKLIDMGYSAYTKKVNSEAGTLTRVYVGPQLEKNKLLEAKKTLDKTFNVESILLKFSPDD